MITQQQLASVLEKLPERFSIGELVDQLIGLDQHAVIPSPPPALEARQTSDNQPLPPELAALYGIIKLRPEDEHKSYDELRWEALQEKYGL